MGVRVINFVTTASIEGRILGLLRFKKSLFTGALDEGGEDLVMIGDNQLTKLMQSFEAVTDQPEKPEPEVVQSVFSALGGVLANFMRSK